MRKKILSILIVVSLILGCIPYGSANIAIEKKKTNSLIEVGSKIYTQHDAENNDIYDLQSNQTGNTIVYEGIFPELSANKAWTTDGKYIDNVSNIPHGATSPGRYIAVQPGEKYFIKTYGVGFTKDESTNTFIKYAPVLFLDDKDHVIADLLTNTLSKSKKGTIITVPEHATKMHVTVFNNQGFTLQKEVSLTSKEMDSLSVTKEKFEKEIEQRYKEYKQDRTVYEKPEKAYITFVNDDSRSTVDEYADLFLSKNIPLVLATVPEVLNDNASSQKETRLEVARRVENAGGEILAHNAEILRKEDFFNYNKMYSCFLRTKQMFQNYKLDVNGIILAGGVGMAEGDEESEKWVSSVYSYCDLYGTKYEHKNLAMDSVYYHRRGGLVNFKNDIDAIKKSIDQAIAENSWLVYYFHDSSEIDTEVLSEVLDYVKSKDKTELEAVTYKEMYEKYATNEQKLMDAAKENPATITFTIDDSYKDVLTVVKPMFDKYHLKASVGVIRDLVQVATYSNQFWYLTEEDVKELYSSGWEILSHGCDFSNIATGQNLFSQDSSLNPVSASGYSVEEELTESKKYLEELLGVDTVRGFVIPNLYTLDEYTTAIKESYQYALGMGSTNSNYSHARTKLSYMQNITNQSEEEAQLVADSVIKEIDEAIQEGSELNFYFHITDTYVKQINWSNYDCNTAALDKILKYLSEKQTEGKVNVRLPGEVYGITESKPGSTPQSSENPGTIEPEQSRDPIVSQTPQASDKPVQSTNPKETIIPTNGPTSQKTMEPVVEKVPINSIKPAVSVTPKPSEGKKPEKVASSMPKLKKPIITTVKSLKKGFMVKLKKKVAGASGYELQYSLKKNFRPYNMQKISSKKLSKNVKKLKSKKYYYVRIRAYCKKNGVVIYSAWSKKMKVKTK